MVNIKGNLNVLVIINKYSIFNMFGLYKYFIIIFLIEVFRFCLIRVDLRGY